MATARQRRGQERPVACIWNAPVGHMTHSLSTESLQTESDVAPHASAKAVGISGGDNYEGLLGRHVRGRESWVSSVDAPIVRREICSAEGLDGAELYHTLIHASRNARRVRVLHSSVNSLRGSESGKRPHGEHCQCGASLSCARAYMSTLQEQLR